MKSAIAAFFASLISGALSFADFRPALSDMVQILTGVQICQEADQEKACSTDGKAEEERLYLITDTSKMQDLHCSGTSYDEEPVYVL
ncbi:hypothetical protein K3G39_08800 [Pontibacter sp. HSC-14F20]|uniref:hypothetical protein n=1 Tax=Pontibacter sp. HSC-14F20 TaxID=2864136 RepID=UPI001C73C7E4|nr:hypothetical protein [Pontibacter sp. HSC-14F20]MBX0333337.1 hypothetical protein [Pontibacter sp. HSC-14F20]